MEKVVNMQHQIDNLSRDRNTITNFKKILEIKNTVTEMKNAFNVLIANKN